MNISVAMCTYNGARFVREQLDSLAAQTRPPDELVVCDDASQDETVSIVQAFAAAAPFPVRVQVNLENLGSTCNFEQAISLCTGDIIALCDQDDVWYSDKLCRMEGAFHDPAVGLVFTDADVVDETLHPLGLRLWQYTQFGSKQQQMFQQGKAFSLLCRGNIVTGATMAFRARFKPLVLPIPEDMVLIHDGWAAFAIATVTQIAFLPEPSIQYRQHPRQQVGVLPRKDNIRRRILQKSHYNAHARQLEALCRRLPDYEGQLTRKQKQYVRRLRAHKAHLERRLRLPARTWQRAPSVLWELLACRYHRYSNGWRSAARDLLY